MRCLCKLCIFNSRSISVKMYKSRVENHLGALAHQLSNDFSENQKKNHENIEENIKTHARFSKKQNHSIFTINCICIAHLKRVP